MSGENLAGIVCIVDALLTRLCRQLGEMLRRLQMQMTAIWMRRLMMSVCNVSEVTVNCSSLYTL